MNRIFLGLLAGVLSPAVPMPSAAEPSTRGPDVAEAADTEHLFGFTEGSDIGLPGEREAESETSGRFGKRGGRFAAIDSGLALKVPLTSWFRIAPGIAFAHYNISRVPGLDDRSTGGFNGGFVETRLRLFDRAEAPFGLTLNVVPSITRRDGGSGAAARGYGSEFGLLADRDLIPDRLYGAVNVSYNLGTVRTASPSATIRGSGTETSGALAYQVLPGLFIGGEIRYLRSYGGLGLDRLAGQAVYLGPTIYAKLSRHAWMSVAWSRQIAGRSGDDDEGSSPLDLAAFDRNQLRVRLGYSF